MAVARAEGLLPERHGEVANAPGQGCCPGAATWCSAASPSARATPKKDKAQGEDMFGQPCQGRPSGRAPALKEEY
jgi:hypothetical protein